MPVIVRGILQRRTRRLLDQDIERVVEWLHDAVFHEAYWLQKVDEANRPKKIMKCASIEQLLVEVAKTERQSGRKLGPPAACSGEECIAELDDGYTIVRLVTVEALDWEGLRMDHCLGCGRYDYCLQSPGSAFLSLRDRFGRPHVTMSVVNGKYVIAMQGKGNRPPIDRYFNILAPFFSREGYKLGLAAFELGRVLDENGVWHKLSELPPDLRVPGRLNLGYTALRSLPPGLYVSGCLLIGSSLIAEIGEGLDVGGLIIGNAPLTTLPQNTRIRGNLDLRGTQVSQLSNGLYVDRDVLIGGTSISKLPDIMSVGGKISLSNSAINSLPNCVPDDQVIITNDRTMSAREFRTH
ncbi:PcfJ domain-containing protein [Rhizobium jaguaris]|nr:PcfJ domain-containing protein [Rhizobium jaguaris]